MKSETSIVACKVRLQEWADQIRECQNRPDGMDIDTWCAQNGISKSNYYYRLRRVRQACLEMHPVETVPSFVELKAPVAELQPATASHQTVAILHPSSHTSIEILDNASAPFLRELLEAMKPC